MDSALSGVPVRTRPEVAEIGTTIRSEDFRVSEHLGKAPSLGRIKDGVDSAKFIEYEKDSVAKVVAVTSDSGSDREAYKLTCGILKKCQGGIAKLGNSIARVYLR